MHTPSRTALSTLLRLFSALALAGTSACVQIEAELPDICRTAQFTYTAPQNALVAGESEQTVEFLPSELSDYLTVLQLNSGSVSVTPAGAVDEVKIVLRPPAGSTEFELTLLSMKPVGEGGAIPGSQADLLPYLGGQLAFQVVGTPPDGTTFLVTVCASAKAVKDFKLSN